MLLQRRDSSDDGVNFFGGFFADGTSPFFVEKSRALDVPFDDVAKIAKDLLDRCGYELIQPAPTSEESAKATRKWIVASMKDGTMSREDGIAKLKALA